MNFSAMYLVGGIFNLIFFALSIVGCLKITRPNGSKFVFWTFFAVAWLVSLASYVLLIFGAPSEAIFITLLRIFLYLFFLATIISLFVELPRLKK